MSKTQTTIKLQTAIQPQSQSHSPQQKPTSSTPSSTPSSTLILKLQDKPRPRVTWTQDTIDNEHMNKLKSNLCCIYHRPGQSSSDTCTSDDQGNAMERDRHTKHMHKKKCSKFNKDKQKQQKQQKDNGNKCGSKDGCQHRH